MKNKILALLATIGLASSVTAVEINENLSINGFIDGSYEQVDTANAADRTTLEVDEIELNFLVNVGNVSGQVHVDTTGTADLDIEQAHFTYSLDNGVSFTFGQYGAALGFEREDPAGLFTFSRAYGANDQGDSFDLGDIDNGGGSVHGLTVAYAADTYSIAASFESGNGDIESTDLNVELSATYTGIENLAIGGGYVFDNPTGAELERDLFNLHAAYTAGKALLAAEYISADDEDETGEDAYMILLDYDFTDKLGGAIRYSEYEISNSTESEKFTIAPNYAITESLGSIIEYSAEDRAGVDIDTIAVELTYTF
jgi:hypothetical protein